MDKKEVPAQTVMELSEDDIRYANVTTTKLHDVANRLHNLFQNGGNMSPKEFYNEVTSILTVKSEINEYFEQLDADTSKLA